MRPTREETYFKVAKAMAERGTCLRAQVGCVIVKNKMIVAQGYNGAPPGMPHCDENFCGHGQEGAFKVDSCRNAVHAELNAIATAAKEGIALRGTELYCTHGPCLQCAQAIVVAGITWVHFIHPYRLEDGTRLLDNAGLNYSQYEETSN